MNKSFLTVAASALVMLSSAAFAQSSTSDTPVLDNAKANAQEICAAHPDQCAQTKQKLQADCQANPTRCAKMKQNAQTAEANLQAKCAADPTKCDKVRGNMMRREDRRQGFRLKHQEKAGTLPSSGQ